MDDKTPIERVISTVENSRGTLGTVNLPNIGEVNTFDALVGTYSAVVATRGIKSLYNNAIAPRILGPRERMANQLLMRGHATVDELLEASYGEWPPKGLDIEVENTQSVSLLKMANDRKFPWQGKTLGLAYLNGARRIEINKDLYGKHSANSTMGHETVHILQGDHSYRADEIFGPGSSIEIDKRQGLFRSNIEARNLYTRFPLASSSRDYVTYLSEGLEVQARIHEILIDGYQDWNRLPLNHEELVVALSDKGLKVPDEVLRNLDNSPTINQTRAVFSSRGKAPLASDKLNKLQRHLPLEGRVSLWNETLPAIYSDLIEMYGDGPGRARFGLGTNRYAEIRRTMSSNPDIPASKHGEEAVDMVARRTNSTTDAGRHITASTDEVADAAKHVDRIGDAIRSFRGGFFMEAGLGVAVGAGVVAFTDASVSDGGKIAFETAVPFGAVATSFNAGDTQRAMKEGMIETAGFGGAIAGAAGGAAAGAAVGSAVPIVGTAIGGVAGGVIGGVAGGVGLGMGTSVLLDNTDIDEAAHDGIVTAVDFVGNAGATVKVGASHALETIRDMTGELTKEFNEAVTERKEMWANAMQNLSERADRAMESTKTTLFDGVTATRESVDRFTRNVTDSISGGLGKVAGFFRRDQPEQDVAQQTIPPNELREQLGQLSMEEAAALPPEMQGLWNIQHAGFSEEKFHEVYEDMMLDSVSREHIKEAVVQVVGMVEGNAEPHGHREEPSHLAQENLETPGMG